MGFLWFVALAWAFVVCGIGLIGMRTDFVPGAIFFLIGAAPTALLTWFVMARASTREAAHAAMPRRTAIDPSIIMSAIVSPTPYFIGRYP